MATMVGKSMDYITNLKDLLVLEYDAIAAYEATVERLDDTALKQQFVVFTDEHRRHISELTELVTGLNREAATEGDMKAMLTKGKVVLADLFGDKAILMAMKTNEDDTNTAYERALNQQNLPAPVMDVLTRALADERKHRAFIVQTLDSWDNRKAA